MSPDPSPLYGRLYALRWILFAISLAAVVGIFAAGSSRIAKFSRRVDSLSGEARPAEDVQPRVFDARFDIWFDPEDAALRLYRDIEAQFIAEDFLLLAFEDRTSEYGVFSRESLEAVARLTEIIERVPYVRRVRSLTSNPWIRWGDAGTNPETGATEEGLIISDLFEEAPSSYEPEAIVTRMIAVLGAERTAGLIGEDRVREVLGPDADFADSIGEPRLIGSVVSEDGRTTSLQIQVLRPKVDPDVLDTTFGDDAKARVSGPSMHTNESQWRAVDGMRFAMARERGLVVDAPGLARAREWIASLPDGDIKAQAERELADPSRPFVRGPDGERIRTHFVYSPREDGRYVDTTDPANPIEAPEGFQPTPLSDYEFHLAGMPVFEWNFMDVGMKDMSIVGYMFLAMALVLLAVFRRARGVFLPLFVVFASIFGMIGATSALGDLLNNLTAIAPNMITAIGIADAVHLVAGYFVLRPRHTNKHALIVDVIRTNALPVFLTSITTAVGFFSLTVSDIVPMRMLGYTGGIGAILAWALSMAIVPALLSILPFRPARRTANEEESDAPPRSVWSDGLVAWVLARRRAITWVSVVTVILSIVGLTRVEIDTDFRAMFPDDNRVISDFRWIEDRMGGAGDLEIVFYGAEFSGDESAIEQQRTRLEELRVAALLAKTGERVLTTEETAELELLEAEVLDRDRRRIAVNEEFLARVEAFERRLKKESNEPDSPLRFVTKFDSALDVLRKMSQVQNENRAEDYRVPSAADVPAAAREPQVEFDDILGDPMYVPAQDAATLTAQYYLQYENGAKPSENLSTLVTADRRGFRIQARLRQASSADLQSAFARIREIAREEFPRLVGNDERVASGEALSTLTLTGKLFLFAGMTQRFTWSFIQSISLALFVITILITVIYRSVVLGLLSTVPNVLPLVVPLAALGWLGIAIDGPAVLVVSVALGVCVDDTIHFFTKFTRARAKGHDIEQSLRETFREVGAALSYTTIVLVLGFSVLSLSEFTPNSMLGKLALVMIALAWVADFIVTPALLSYTGAGRPKASQST